MAWLYLCFRRLSSAGFLFRSRQQILDKVVGREQQRRVHVAQALADDVLVNLVLLRTFLSIKKKSSKKLDRFFYLIGFKSFCKKFQNYSKNLDRFLSNCNEKF